MFNYLISKKIQVIINLDIVVLQTPGFSFFKGRRWVLEIQIPDFLPIPFIISITKKTVCSSLCILSRSHSSFLALFLCLPFVRFSSISVSSSLGFSTKIVDSNLLGPGCSVRLRFYTFGSNSCSKNISCCFPALALTQLFYMQEFILSSVSLILILSHHLHGKCKSYPFPTPLFASKLAWCSFGACARKSRLCGVFCLGHLQYSLIV